VIIVLNIKIDEFKIVEKQMIKTNILGKTGVTVTRVGLGGEGVLRTTRRTDEARAVIKAANFSGITYYDCARVYSDSELYYGSVWKEAPEARRKIFQASKSASRDKKSALRDLEETLARLNVDHLDLWQIHDVRTQSDLAQISGPGGALEAFMEAKAKGKVRHIGVTGHHDPDILTRAILDWPVDTVMMPVNPVEGVIGGFLTRALPAAKSKGLGIIGMKILGAGHYIAPQLGVTPDLLIRYALDQGISVAIVGCSTPAEVEVLAQVGESGQPLRREEQDQLMKVFTPQAKHLAFYRGVL
jgi:aryl-alcohol dehydrogenase-like predicted oxidoreductase